MVGHFRRDTEPFFGCTFGRHGRPSRQEVDPRDELDGATTQLGVDAF